MSLLSCFVAKFIMSLPLSIQSGIGFVSVRRRVPVLDPAVGSIANMRNG